MMRPRSLQWRLSLWLGLGMTIFWAVAAWATAYRLHREMDEVFDSTLEETAQRILPVAALEILGRDADDMDQRVATLRQHDEYFTYIVRDASGNVLLLSHSADPAAFPPYSGMGFASTATHRLYSDSAVQGSITITVAEPLSHRRMVARHALSGLALPLGILLPFSLVGVLGIVRLSMMPIRAFRSGIEARGGGDLAPVMAEGLPSEIEPVARSVNRLLDRLKRALEAERTLSAKSAHELRTPIAAALAQAQRMILEAPDDAVRERASDMESALRRLSRLSEKLMQLARAEGGRLLAEKPIDIAVILRMVAGEIAGHAESAGRIALTLPDIPVFVNIDPDAFAVLARNLIENALRHGDPMEPVGVTLSAGGVLHVANAGPPVPAELLAHLSEPFERGRSQADGAGLGLAIARAIAAGTGGRLDLISPIKGQQDGFEAIFSAGKYG
jgi:two-component system OmpR family sensor kinase